MQEFSMARKFHGVPHNDRRGQHESDRVCRQSVRLFTDCPPAEGSAAAFAPETSARPAGSSHRNLHRLPVRPKGAGGSFWPDSAKMGDASSRRLSGVQRSWRQRSLEGSPLHLSCVKTPFMVPQATEVFSSTGKFAGFFSKRGL